MPSDTAPAITPTTTPARRRCGTDLTLGVFAHDGEWKVYRPQERAIHYDTREGAVMAAEEAALAAAREGRRVELFVQEEDGALRQAAIELR